MPYRYQAPKNVTGVHTSAGNEYRADKSGIITVPDNAPSGDHVSLCAAGWTPLATKKAASSSNLGELRKEYKTLTGKKPSPSLDEAALAAKIAELKDEPPAGDA